MTSRIHRGSFPKAYTHNGYFKTLAGLVHFYNTRDVRPTCARSFPESVALALDCWPSAEVPETVNKTDMGALGVSPADEAAIVAFLETLTEQRGSRRWRRGSRDRSGVRGQQQGAALAGPLGAHRAPRACRCSRSPPTPPPDGDLPADLWARQSGAHQVQLAPELPQLLRASSRRPGT